MVILETREKSADERLRHLQREIVAAEERLESLHAEISDAHSEHGVAELGRLTAENERLEARTRRDADKVDSVLLALDVAVRASETDPLTGLPNRIVLWARLEHDVEVARRRGTLLGVFLMDLDGFKKINDDKGHAAGDMLLQHIASRLKQVLRQSDTVCRIGGDEFVVLIPEMKLQDRDAVTRKLRNAVAFPCVVDGHRLECTASIGGSVFPIDARDPEALVRKADEAMYRFKRAHR